MSDIRTAKRTTLNRTRAHRGVSAAAMALMFFAPAGASLAGLNARGNAKEGSSASYDARMVRDPVSLAALRDGTMMSESTSSAILSGRMDDAAMIATFARYNLLESPMAANHESAYSEPKRFFARLPEPDGWTAVAATFALGIFFFLRRVA